jgi:hypothetical protein
MDTDQVLLALIGAGASFVTFCLMRFPKTRRPQFQQYGPFSLSASFFGAFLILAASVFMACAPAMWH